MNITETIRDFLVERIIWPVQDWQAILHAFRDQHDTPAQWLRLHAPLSMVIVYDRFQGFRAGGFTLADRWAYLAAIRQETDDITAEGWRIITRFWYAAASRDPNELNLQMLAEAREHLETAEATP
jgi:hypothetical protein